MTDKPIADAVEAQSDTKSSRIGSSIALGITLAVVVIAIIVVMCAAPYFGNLDFEPQEGEAVAGIAMIFVAFAAVLLELLLYIILAACAIVSIPCLVVSIKNVKRTSRRAVSITNIVYAVLFAACIITAIVRILIFGVF